MRTVQDRMLAILADVSRLSWMDWGLCQETDPEAFFPERGDRAEPAKRVCRQCPVREQCLDYALRHSIRAGIWGGLSAHERRGMPAGQQEAA